MKGIPFIDVGMGLNRKRGPINGLLRTTYYSAEHGQEVREKDLAPLSDDPDDIYRTNIQISELNSLNACLAVVRFKQLRASTSRTLPTTTWSMGGAISRLRASVTWRRLDFSGSTTCRRT